jgi:hypothetical protein
MPRLATTAGILVALLYVPGARAEPVLATLAPGQHPRAIEARLRSLGLTDLAIFSGSEPQGLARGLADSRLLETLNTFALAPRGDDGGLDPKAFGSFLQGSRAGRTYLLAFGEGGPLRFALARLPVPVDRSADGPDRWARSRLNPLRAALAELGAFALAPLQTDRHGNTFTWKGRARGATIWAWYLPEQDELRVLWAAD